jgi:environmental stress-induced protein Ves
MIRLIPQVSFVEGRWRNGQGVSWEIASHKKADAADFSWRFAKARIDNDVPFSIYPGMDRIFMMIEGQGMDLEFEDGKVLRAHEKFVPHEFSCDLPLVCKLRGGPSLDLNLFTARDTVRSECEVLDVNSQQDIKLSNKSTVFFALDGACALETSVGSAHLELGDAALVLEEKSIICRSDGAKLFVGKLHHT